MDQLVVPMLKNFRSGYPSIVIEVAVRNALLDLDKRETDVALRVASNPPKALVGVRLARLEFAIYGAKAYLEGREGVSPRKMDWLAPDAWLGKAPVVRWIQSVIASDQVVAKADSFIVLRELADKGLGVAALPCCVGRFFASLRQVSLLPESTSNDLCAGRSDDRYEESLDVPRPHADSSLKFVVGSHLTILWQILAQEVHAIGTDVVDATDKKRDERSAWLSGEQRLVGQEAKCDIDQTASQSDKLTGLQPVEG